MKTLTVFTPAYNRAHTIGRTYESLCRQTCKDFEWLIIDDGSTDNTRELVQGWIDEKPEFPIRYIYQANQGMHGAHNTAYDNITTELNTCIDSDDWMPDDAVEKIIMFWREHGSGKYAGIIGLDVKESGELIGTPLPNDLYAMNLSEFYQDGGAGDKKLVLRTDIVKLYPPYPRFDKERYFSLGYLYLLIDQDYKCLCLNEPLVVVDYQPDGSSHSMYRQYWNNPRGFMYLRQEHIRIYKSFRLRFRSSIHYISHCLRAKAYRHLLSTSRPLMALCALPFGVCLFFFTRYKVNHNIKMSIK
ncbi:MAG: glycosyltransferase family 2 protein [Prevotella sp.]|nr:glycosyltransferase family 2 protein [Prevotella sp.]